MPISIPELAAPLEALAACIRVPLADHEDLVDLFPDQREVEIAKGSGSTFVRLIRDKFGPQHGHFHVDVSEGHIWTTKPTSLVDIEGIQAKCDRIIGQTLEVRFESRFKVDRSEISKASMLSAWTTLALNVGGTSASLAAAGVRLSDSVFRELRWKQTTQGDAGFFTVEILGTLDQYPVLEQLFATINGRAHDGLMKFVRGRVPQKGQQ